MRPVVPPSGCPRPPSDHSVLDATALAEELLAAHTTGATVATRPSARDAAFDMTAAYATQAEFNRLRRAAGRKTAGVKVGFANKAVWRALKLETLVWAPVWDDTVRYAADGHASLSLERLRAPKIEPEIVFKLKSPVGADAADAAAALDAVEWIAIGFEIIDCPYPDWTFEPVDFVAAFGFHAQLIVGAPTPVESATIPTLVDALPRFTVTLSKHGEVVEEGSGRSSLRSPALCLVELVAAMRRRAGSESLVAGDLVSSGTLTESTLIGAGDTWTAVVEGLDIGPLTLHV